MSDKKQPDEETQPEDVADALAETGEIPEGLEQPEADLDALNKQLEEADSRAAEYKDSWLRVQAEFQNYKKRIERDNETLYASMKGDIIKKVLPVLDDLERALQNRPVDDAWAGGIELIVRKLQTTLESEGVTRIQAEGEVFDPNIHEAISHEPADQVKSGCVIAVVQNGYMLGERLIRPALVRVAQ
jgi:molecular chaperone GrpE